MYGSMYSTTVSPKDSMKKIILVLFFCILFLGAFLRFYRLGDIPVGLHIDEAYFGYNAYALSRTGRDMTGNFLPLHFASFLFSPAGYSYVSIPWIFLFGLSSFSTRFASAFFGSLSLLVAFFLGKLITTEKKYQYIVALGSMLFLAISPWNIDLARTATENSVVVFFLGLGLIFLLLWKQKQSFWYGVLGFISLTITLGLYQAPRAFLPLFLPVIITMLFIKQKKKFFLAIGLYVLMILIPVFLIVKSPQLSQRITMLSILNNPGAQLLVDEQLREDGVMHTSVLASRIFHNKVLAYTSQIAHNYALHFSYDFLFGDGYLPDRYKVSSMGLLYIIEIPFIVLGLYFLLKNQPIVG